MRGIQHESSHEAPLVEPHPTPRMQGLPRAAAAPPLARVDLHTHTCFSVYDGVLSPADLVDSAAREGLSGIAVTDHFDYDDAWMGALAARNHARERGDIVVWPGIEYNVERGTHRGHMLVYFDDPADLPPRGLTAGRLLDHCEARGLLTVHPHPFSAFGIADWRVITRSPFVELNGDHGDRGPNLLVRKAAARWGWRLVASSDAHDPRQLGSAWTLVPRVLPDLRATLAAGAHPVLRGFPIAGVAAKLARFALAPVTIPWNLGRSALTSRRVRASLGRIAASPPTSPATPPGVTAAASRPPGTAFP